MGANGSGLAPQQELSVEFEELAQAEADATRDTMPFDPTWHLFNAQVEVGAQTEADAHADTKRITGAPPGAYECYMFGENCPN